MANTILAGTLSERPAPHDAPAFAVIEPPNEVGLYISNGSTWARALAPASSDGSPDDGENATLSAGTEPDGPFTFTIDGVETTVLAVDADTDTMADALSIAATGETGNVIAQGEHNSDTLDDGTVFLFVKKLGARPRPTVTCSDENVELGGEDTEGEYPTPNVGAEGQLVVSNNFALWIYLPSLNQFESSQVFWLLANYD